MFRLDFPVTARWIDLPQGVRVQVRPLDAAVISAAQAYADRATLEIVKDRAERLAANMPLDGTIDTDDPALRRGTYEVELAAGLARYGIIAWEGVGDAAGEAACTPANAEKLARSSLGPTFLRKYQEPQAAVAAEGNASATARNGSSGAVATTAPAAGTDAPSVPAA